MSIERYIKTQCGLERYQELKNKKGLLRKLSFYWFVVIASIRDSFLNRN